MASTFTPNINAELQGTGDHPGTWGSVLNTAVITVIDQVFGGVQTLSLASTDVTVSTAQSQNNAFLLTGALTADVSVIFPSIGRTIFVANNTTGAHSVTLKTATAGVTVVIPQGASGFYVLNVTDVLQATLPGVPIGGVQAFAMTTPPIGWLECDGSAISRSAYSGLFNLIGTTFGVGNGTTTFNIPDMRGQFARGWDHGRGVDPARAFGSLQAFATSLAGIAAAFLGNALPATFFSITLPWAHGANGTGNAGKWSDGDSGGGSWTNNTTAKSPGTPSGNVSLSGGATETRPTNVALLYAIRAV